MFKYDPPKTHWLKERWAHGSYAGTIALCGHTNRKYANKKRAVTCLRCQKILAGYQGEKK